MKNNYIVFIFIALIIVIAFSIYVPGLFSIDDVSYYLMAKSFSDSFTYNVWNGFDEYKSAAFGVFEPVYYRKGTYVKYPPYYPLIAFPFYRLFGINGLFYLNILSFGGALCFLYFTAIKLFDDRKLAERSVYLYALSTFAMEYAIGLWPHMLSVFIVMAGLYLFLLYLLDEKKRYAILILSSAVLSFSIGIRLQNVIFLTVAVMLIIFFKRKLGDVLIFTSGAILPLTVQGIINNFRFGSFDPFSYGHYRGNNLGYYLEHPAYFIILGFVIAAVIAFLKKPEWFSGKKLYFVGVVCAVFACLGIITIKELRGIFYYWIYTFYCNLIDLTPFYNAAIERSQIGAVVFGGIVKKAIFQSCPYLVLAFFAPILMLKERVEKKILFFTLSLFIFPLLFISSLYFHGGYAFNIRYALEFIPFGIILFCWAIRKIRFEKVEIIAAFLMALCFSIMFYYQKMDEETIQRLIIYIPLLISFLIMLFCLLNVIFNYRSGKGGSFVYNFLIVVSVLYGFCAGWIGDVVSSRKVRLSNCSSYSTLDKMIEDNSLIAMVVDKAVEITPVKENKKVRIAYTPLENLKIYLPMIESFYSKGISCYIVSYEGQRKILEAEMADYLKLKKISDGKLIVYRVEGK